MRGAPGPNATRRAQSAAWKAYLLSLTLPLGMLAAGMALGERSSEAALELFLVPILVSAYLGGLGPGLVATAVSALAGDLFLLPPEGAFSVVQALSSLVWLNLIATGTLVSSLVGSLRRSRVDDGSHPQPAPTQDVARSHENLSLLVRQAPISIAMFDPQMCYLATSQRWIEEYGRGHRELIGRCHYDIHPDLPEEWKQVHRRGLLGEVVRNDEDSWLQADGSRHWLRWAVHPWLDAQGEIGGIIISAEDITARKQAEAQRDELARQRQLALGAARLGWWHYDPVSRGASWDERFKEIFEVSESTRPNEGILDRVHPADLPRLQAAVQAALDPVEPTPYSIEYRLKGPRERWVEAHGAVSFEGDGDARHATSLVGTVQDITERKRAEKQLVDEMALSETLLASLPGIVYVIDRNGGLVRWNRDYEKVVGRSSRDLLGTDALRPIVEEDRPLLAGKIRDVFERGGLEQAEARLQNASGEVRYYLLSAQRVEIAGEPLLVGTGLDLTDRRLGEEQQRQLEAQLRQAQKMEAVGRLAGGVAHDFNNMLNVILGYVDLALRRVKSVDPICKNLIEIRHAAERSADLTRRLLGFSRRQAIAPKVLDLNRQMTGMEGLLRRIIGEDIALELVLGPDLWPVCLDPSQVDQVLANLSVNARDAMPDGGKLTIVTGNVTLDEAYCAVHADARPGDYALLAVRDTGCGMDARTLERAFEPFFTTKPEGQGTGLGLAMIYGIARQNGGSVEIESEVGKGTTFRLYLPRLVEGREPRAEPLLAPVGAPPRGHETILLVEDEPSLRELAQELLEEMGYRVLAAASPGEGISLAETEQGAIDLLLTDVVMPVMNGKDLSERIRALRPHIRVLFTSGYTADVIAHRGVLDAGVQLLEKPFTLDTLARQVRQALGRP